LPDLPDQHEGALPVNNQSPVINTSCNNNIYTAALLFTFKSSIPAIQKICSVKYLLTETVKNFQVFKIPDAHRFSFVQVILSVAVWGKGIGQINFRSLVNLYGNGIKTFAAQGCICPYGIGIRLGTR
jgi:hypothetical protein